MPSPCHSIGHVDGGSGSWTQLPEEAKVCCGVMSPVRRTFCLLVTFDLIFSFIVWVIYIQVGEMSLQILLFKVGFQHKNVSLSQANIITDINSLYYYHIKHCFHIHIFQVASVTATRCGLSRGLLGLN